MGSEIMLITSEHATLDITAEEFEKLGSDTVLSILKFETAKTVDIQNLLDTLRSEVAKDIARGATALNKAIEGRYGISSTYGFR
jgi:hypothetical protein